MTHTILLSKVLGIFMIIAGVAIVLRRHDFVEVIVTFARNRALRVLISAIELAAGLFLVVLHNEWGSVPAAIVSLVGWILVAESVTYLLLPDRIVEAFILYFGKPGTLLASGILVVLLGLYLAAAGFSAAWSSEVGRRDGDHLAVAQVHVTVELGAVRRRAAIEERTVVVQRVHGRGFAEYRDDLFMRHAGLDERPGLR